MAKPKKKIDWQKKYELEKKAREKDNETLNNTIQEISNERNKAEEKLEDKGKRHIIKIITQTHTIQDFEQAKERVRKLIDANVWYFEVT